MWKKFNIERFIGEWKTNGSLKIIDRKKHIFKLAQGEYVAPERIENVYLTAGCVSQIFVTGDSLKSFLVGIVVPDSEGFSSWCEKNVGISGGILGFRSCVVTNWLGKRCWKN